ncbi:MAG: glycosyltransferase family 9 protein [Acidobacteria bacterium]|nr:glycosyltransferase family 9 protein [Acidobacteriota bacterium]
MQNEPRSILVVDTSRFGVAVLALPALQALRQQFPHTYILTATTRGLSELLKAFQLADEVVDLGLIKPAEQSYAKAVKRLAQLLQATRRRDFDYVCDFAPRLETQMAARLGWRTRHLTPSRYTHLLDFFFKRDAVPGTDHAEECATVVKKIGIRAIAQRFAFVLPMEGHQRFEELLKRHGSRGAEPLVVLYASQCGAARQWSVAQFGEIAVRLVNNFAARVVVLDEPFGNDGTRTLKALLPKGSIVLAAPRAMDFLAALGRASLVITDERGIAKTASDLDAPVIELADSPSPYAALASYRVLRASSLNRITTDAVYEAAAAMIQEGRTMSLFRR